MTLTYGDAIAALGPAVREPLPLGNKSDPVDELFYILLTVMTRSQPRIDRAYDGLLRLTGGDWAALTGVERSALRAVLEPLGFVNRREAHLVGCAEAVTAVGGDLSHLDAIGDADALGWLTALPGVGLKSAKCVLMYSMGRDVVPVDVHVLRVAKRLGLLPMDVPWPKADEVLERDIPDDLKYDVHVRFVEHGREVCTTRAPRCGSCVLADLCPSAHSASEVRADYV